MEQEPSSPIPIKRQRGRPPRPDGATPKAEIQRRYRERLAATGKAVRLIDLHAAPPPFDAETHFICERATFSEIRDKYHHALSKIGLLEEDRARWQSDCAKAEAELKREEQRHLNTLKDKIMLQQEIAALKRQLAEPARKRRPAKE